jgi:CRP/FNR family transcriptional regulator, anaerobic regulatory protein
VGAATLTDIPSCAAGVPFLQTLPPASRAFLARSMRHRHVERGDILGLAGEPVEHLTVVAQGRLGLSLATSGGREQLLRTLGPGEFLGELALFAPATYDGDLVALKPSVVCQVPRDAVQDIVKTHPDAALRLVETLAHRLAQAERRIGDLGLHDVAQRLAGALLDAADESQVVTPGTRLRLAIPWRELAARIGTTPESLSRRLRALQETGAIRHEGGRSVVILDPERLRQLAD